MAEVRGVRRPTTWPKSASQSSMLDGKPSKLGSKLNKSLVTFGAKLDHPWPPPQVRMCVGHKVWECHRELCRGTACRWDLFSPKPANREHTSKRFARQFVNKCRGRAKCGQNPPRRVKSEPKLAQLRVQASTRIGRGCPNFGQFWGTPPRSFAFSGFRGHGRPGVPPRDPPRHTRRSGQCSPRSANRDPIAQRLELCTPMFAHVSRGRLESGRFSIQSRIRLLEDRFRPDVGDRLRIRGRARLKSLRNKESGR